MSRLVDIIRDATKTKDKDSSSFKLHPPLNKAEIREFEATLSCSLPEEIRELLQYCQGFSGDELISVDFTGRDCNFSFTEAFPYGLPIAGDGLGNFWVLDLLPTTTAWGPIYFASHDPAVILYQSPTLTEFLVELFKQSKPPYESLIDAVRNDQLYNIWRTNPGVLSYEDCIAMSDNKLQSFAFSLGSTFQFIDLRNAAIGYGFSWGRYGANTVIKRHGELPIFAYQKKQGLFAKLFGRS